MENKQYWQWRVSTTDKASAGGVWAIDPRDAVSRALCFKLQSGQMVGNEYGISADILHDVPANADTRYRCKPDGVAIEVWVDQPAATHRPRP